MRGQGCEEHLTLLPKEYGRGFVGDCLTQGWHCSVDPFLVPRKNVLTPDLIQILCPVSREDSDSDRRWKVYFLGSSEELVGEIVGV